MATMLEEAIGEDGDILADEPEDVITTRELAEKLGVSESTARRRVREAVRDGFMEYAGKVPRKDMTGREIPVHAYRLTGDGDDDS